MSALSQYQEVLVAIQEYLPAFKAAQDALIEQYNAIDPSSPDAQAQYDAIAKERERVTSDTTIGLAGLQALVNQANSLYQAAFAEDPTAANAEREQIRTILASVAGRVTNTAKTVQTAITNAKEVAAVAANAPTGAPNPNNINGTPASDDASYDKAEAAKLANYSNPATAAGSQKTDIVTKASTSTTPAGAAGNGASYTNTSVSSGPKPGTRLQNPLGNFASYTYQLSLYMITPDAYEAFMLSGKKNINALSAVDATGKSTGGGAFLIAQSGGINNATSQRAPGFELDFHIDNLKIKSAVSTKATQTSSNVTDMSFTITEPMGFSFVTKLKRASDAIKKNSKLKNFDKYVNASKQFFILGIRFQGYDKNGQIANASQYFSDDTFNASPDASGVYERFYDILIQSIKFKLHGGATQYSITATSIGTAIGMGTAKGIVDNNTPVVADTVENALGPNTKTGLVSLFGTINSNEVTSAKGRKDKDGNQGIPNVYKVEWLGAADQIKSATLKSDADTDKKKQAMTKASKSSDVNEAAAIKALADSNNILISIPKGTPIPQAIKNIIMHSSYLENAMKTLFTTAEEVDKNTGTAPAKPQKDPPPLKWYNLSTKIKCLGFDTTIGDFAYEITYVIQPYETPASTSPYGKASKYYGPHKRYDYWFTGKNSEIISYEQTFDNTLFSVALVPNGNPESQGNGANIANLPNKQTNQDRTIRAGAGNEAQNTYMASLFDVGAYAQMKMSILGDPDYLAQETPDSINDVYRQFYKADGFTINPNGGQVFIEIGFNEGVDYGGIIKNNSSVNGDNGSGLLTVNDSIYFWNYPPEVIAKMKGVSYMLTSVESVFSKGKFTQNLEGFINDIPASATATTPNTPDQSSAETNRLANAGTKPPPSTANTGLTSDAPVVSTTQPSNLTTQPGAENTGVTNAVVTAATGASQQTAPTNNPATPQVQNDDSSSSAGSTQAGAAMVASTNAGILAALGTTGGGRENPVTTAQQAIAAGA